jgi:RNA polymerase sigma-70 factor (ECF subfamily)
MAAGESLDDALGAARRGDARGFDALFRAFGPAVVGYLRGRGAEDADGLANEVFVRAFRRVQAFEGDVVHFRAWLFTITRNVLIDDHRRAQRRPAEVTYERAPEAWGGDVEEDALTSLARERVLQLLEKLSPDQRDVVLLRVVADLSVEEVATITGKGYEAVKALQRRGLARLRRAICAETGVPR